MVHTVFLYIYLWLNTDSEGRAKGTSGVTFPNTGWRRCFMEIYPKKKKSAFMYGYCRYKYELQFSSLQILYSSWFRQRSVVISAQLIAYLMQRAHIILQLMQPHFVPKYTHCKLSEKKKLKRYNFHKDYLRVDLTNV